MQKFFFALAFAVTASGQGGNYRVTDRREIISECYDYSFRLPDKWYISASNPAPFMFNFPPQKLVSAGVGIPRGGATVSMVADTESHDVGSVERWIELDRAAHRFSSVRTTTKRGAPSTSRNAALRKIRSSCCRSCRGSGDQLASDLALQPELISAQMATWVSIPLYSTAKPHQAR